MNIEKLKENVLLGLYEFRIQGGVKSLNSFFKKEDNFNRHQSKLIFEYLSERGLIKGRANSSGYLAEITFEGIKYVEEKYKQISSNSASGVNYTMREKYDIIMHQLYIKKTSKYFEIYELIPESDLDLGEAVEIGKALERKGYVNFSYSKSNAAISITALGKEFVEENLILRVDYNPSERFSENEKRELSSKLDELLIRIKNVEMGQQIIYDDFIDEFKELKILLNVLGKKDWKQLLYGKLVDAGLGTISENIFNQLLETFNANNFISE